MNSKVRVALPFVLASLAITNSALAYESVKPNGCKGVSLCQIYPNIDSNRFYVDVGFILEQMRVTGTDFAYSADSSFNTLPQDGSLLRPKFDLDWGVTAAIGYHFEHDDWFLRIGFDWLKSIGKNNSNSDWSQILVPTNIWKVGMLAGANVQSFSKASSSLKVNFYDLMIDLNKGIYFTGCFSFEPHAGLKLAWIFYDNTIVFTNDSASSPYHLNRYINDDFWGIGPSFGMNLGYIFGEGFSLFLDSNIAVLFGNASVTDEVNYTADTTNYRTFMRDSHVVMSPAVRALLGIKYEQSVYCEKQYLAVRAGLDTNYYWNQYNHVNAMYDGETYSFVGSDNNSFGMIGLLVDLSWEF